MRNEHELTLQQKILAQLLILTDEVKSNDLPDWVLTRLTENLREQCHVVLKVARNRREIEL